MEVLLVRHAHALDAAPGMSDAERPLSRTGRETMQQAARGLGNLLGARSRPLVAVLTSPRKRAIETARILAREVNGGEAVVECPPLGGEYRWRDLLSHLEHYPPESRVALVGHEPHLGRLAGWLLARGETMAIPLKTSSVIAFEVRGSLADPTASLLWLLTPEQLRMLK